MIPKKVHYCWLSGERFPKKMQRCMESWHRHLGNYEFVLWDAKKVAEIAEGRAWIRHWVEKKNYAFAADFIRLWALWSEGGIYLDTDVEVLKPLDDLLDRELLVGEECGTGDVEAAVLGAEKGSAAIRKVLDSFGAFTDETLPKRMRRVLADAELLPCEYLSPKSWITGKLVVSEKTHTIHHFAASWLSPKERAAQWAGRHFGSWAIPVVRWIGHRFEK